MPLKTITIAGQDYMLAPITAGQAKVLKGKFADPLEFNISLTAASLQAGGTPTSEDAVRALPYFAEFLPLQAAAMEVNGLGAEGEAGAAPEPAAADSTLDTSTEQ